MGHGSIYRFVPLQSNHDDQKRGHQLKGEPQQQDEMDVEGIYFVRGIQQPPECQQGKRNRDTGVDKRQGGQVDSDRSLSEMALLNNREEEQTVREKCQTAQNDRNECHIDHESMHASEVDFAK